MMILTKDLVPVTGHLVEISGYDLLLRDGAQLVAERSHFVSSVQGVTAVELDGLLSVQAFRIAE